MLRPMASPVAMVAVGYHMKMNRDWNIEFRGIQFPTVELFMTSKSQDQSQINIALGKSVETYPKYVIHFERYLAFRSHEEMAFEFDH